MELNQDNVEEFIEDLEQKIAQLTIEKNFRLREQTEDPNNNLRWLPAGYYEDLFQSIDRKINVYETELKKVQDISDMLNGESFEEVSKK